METPHEKFSGLNLHIQATDNQNSFLHLIFIKVYLTGLLHIHKNIPHLKLKSLPVVENQPKNQYCASTLRNFDAKKSFLGLTELD